MNSQQVKEIMFASITGALVFATYSLLDFKEYLGVGMGILMIYLWFIIVRDGNEEDENESKSS